MTKISRASYSSSPHISNGFSLFFYNRPARKIKGTKERLLVCTLGAGRIPWGGIRRAGRRTLGQHDRDSVPARGWRHRAGRCEVVAERVGTGWLPPGPIGWTAGNEADPRSLCHLVAGRRRSLARPPNCCLVLTDGREKKMETTCYVLSEIIPLKM